LDLLKLAKEHGVTAVFAFLFWMQITSVQASMQKQLDTKSAQDSQREARMAAQIDSLEARIQGDLKEVIETQKAVIRDATHAIRDNTTVMSGVKALLPKQP